MDMRWPEEDIASMKRQGAFRRGAAICRRGHVSTSTIDPSRPAQHIAENCTQCGARVISACPGCGFRIRGKHYRPGVVSSTAPPRPSFCDGCGAAFPWATREERIFELENLLDEEVPDEADRVVIQAQLARLKSGDLSDKDERKAWETIKTRAGGGLSSGPVQRVLEGLVSAAIRAQLGI